MKVLKPSFIRFQLVLVFALLVSLPFKSQAQYISPQEKRFQCEELYTERNSDDLPEIYGLQSFEVGQNLIRGTQLAPGWYLYLLSDFQHIDLIPRAWIFKNGRTHLQKHAALAAKTFRAYKKGAGEIYVDESGAIAVINNRSGSFKPKTEHLTAASKFVQAYFKTKRDVVFDDYSRVSKKHPLYVANSVLDTVHTISAVDMIGVEAFKKCLESKNPKNCIAKLIVQKQTQDPSEAKVAKPRKPPALPPKLSLSALWNQLKKAPSRSWANYDRAPQFGHFYKIYAELRKEGQLYLDREEFEEFFMKNVLADDEIDVRFTLTDVNLPVVMSDEQISDYSFTYISVKLDDVTKSFTPYHKDTLEHWAETFKIGSYLRVSAERGGVFVRKSKSSKNVQFYYTGQYDFRFHGPNWASPDAVYRVKNAKQK